MIKNFLRGFGALSLSLVPLLGSPTHAAQPTQGLQAAEVTTLADAVGLVHVDEEDRTGYSRSSFRHWNSGDIATDGCHTRNEVLLVEAIVAPAVESGCKLTGGTWLSYYDNQEVSDPRTLDIDHMVSVPATA